MPARARRPTRTGLVTLTTDVGWPYAAQMKAVLFGLLPTGRVVDLAHDLPAHQVREAAFVLRAMAERFPPGTVHVAVVDPGVGGPRAPLVIETGDGSALVGPDNGVLAPLARKLGSPRAFRIDPERLGVGPRVGTTFDGRDVFAPTAARLALGRDGSELGTAISYEDLLLPGPALAADAATGEVVHVDSFGNLITNIPTEGLPPRVETLSVRVGPRRARRVPWATSYLAIGLGRLGALGSSFGTVEVALGEGSAGKQLGAKVGDLVELRWSKVRGAHARETVNSRARLRT